jgi:heme-degrading monooxygenase HmoA
LFVLSFSGKIKPYESKEVCALKIYLTTGTPDFMSALGKKYEKKNVIFMNGTSNSLLLHETEGKSVFQSPRQFEVVHSIGDLTHHGYFVFNHIPVTDEGRPVFEHRYQNLSGSLQDEPGFIAFRLCQPIKSETYVLLTEWKDASSYQLWEGSVAGKAWHPENWHEPGVDTVLHLFESGPYVSTYKTPKPDEK